MSYELEKNRINAFIFIENKFYSNKFHTECVTDFLIDKGLIKTDKEFYSMLECDKTKEKALKWKSIIEEHCVFGETALINGELVVVIFDKLTEYGLTTIRAKADEVFGIKKILLAKYILGSSSKFEFIEI